MTQPDFTMTPDALNAHLLDGVMDSTTPPNETPAQAAKRQASIVQMFIAYDPADAVQAMIACHCIALEFMLRGAMRDAANTDLDPPVLARLRSSATAISKALHMWMTKLEKLRAKTEAHAAEAAKPAKAAAPPAQAPHPAPPEQPPLHPAKPRTVTPPHPGLAALAVKKVPAAALSNGHAPGPEARANL